MKYWTLVKRLAIVLVMVSCSKEEQLISQASTPQQPVAPPVAINSTPSTTILVDASKDGGVWWYPQAGNFSADAPHQGKELADYLRSLGFKVDEVPRGQTISWNFLKQYNKVIRAVGFGKYATEEIAAYDSLLNRSAALLLLSDHLQNSANDNLSAHLGLDFIGAYTGTLTQFTSHATTAGVSSLPYIAGSVIAQPDPNTITILGYWGNGGIEGGAAAMGIKHHPSSKIFFMGDANGIEQLPQPFTRNLIQWLFQ